MNTPRLHSDTIETVKERADIVDIVSERVVLRRRGKDYLGLCPFHEEKTPSFSVSPAKQMYYCFGCGAGGNAVKFLMEAGKQSFADVVLGLAQRYQVPVKTQDPEEYREFQRQLTLKEQLYEILAVAGSFYQHALRQPQGEVALTYLQEKRLFSEGTMQTFELGYAPAGWETLYRYLVEAKRYSVLLVEQAGLIRKRKTGEGYYDYFRDRLMIPIHDLQGRIIGFGSRTLGNDEPKYLNSPETEVFSKGKTLFALDKAKSAIAKQDRVVVVEGYFDAIALHAAGIDYAVAALGTAFSQEQLRSLSRYTESKQVIFNFDADTAGMKATQRAIGEIEKLVYSGQVQLRVLNLPGGKDADEFLKSRDDALEVYQEQLDNAPLWLDWQIQQLVQGEDLKKADRFEKVSKEMIKLLAKIEDSNQRTHYVQNCAEILSQGDGRLTPVYNKNLSGKLERLRKSIQRNKGKQNKNNFDTKAESITIQQQSEQYLLKQAEALLLMIYLHCSSYREIIINALEEKDLIFSLPQHRFLWQKIIGIYAENEKNLIANLQDLSREFPEQITKIGHLFHLTETQANDLILRVPMLIHAAIAALEKVTYEKNLNYCLARWKNLDLSTDLEEMKYLSQEIQETKQKIAELEKERYFSIFDLIE
ncbi:DNA primase [Spirulina sp. 06S082]|uniref:DNA primase n=1 Tax=Spirulina sp. 06S082 TaxID=3110248 RepID=UPI002B1EDD05|nr:DNA primase [Spirulina sp. 06S082]MEA5470809.1 DNA primase [Spirulina sp. 06S082]